VTDPSAPSLSTEQLGEVLTLIKGSDGVELKLTVPDANRRSAVAALGMDPLDAQLRQIYFFDTTDLALDKRGVVVRVRRVQGKPSDTIVKLRPLVPDELPSLVRTSPNFAVEVDAMPGGFVCSGAMKAQVSDAKVKEVLAGRRPLRKLFTPEQRDLYAAHAPWLWFHDLSALGPINALKLKFRPAGFDRRMVAELWNYPDGSRILELSTKCTPAEAFDVAAATKSFLSDRGIDLSAPQQTKTRTALEFFAKELADDPGDE
jgi:hypothetical protein